MRMMRVEEVAERLDVGADAVYDLAAEAGRLRCHRVGLGRGTIRIGEEHLAACLAGAESRPAPAPKGSTPRLKLRHLRA